MVIFHPKNGGSSGDYTRIVSLLGGLFLNDNTLKEYVDIIGSERARLLLDHFGSIGNRHNDS